MGDASTRRDLAFFCYAREDADWLKAFEVLLKPYVRQGKLRMWADQHIAVGDRWEREIQSGLLRARVGVVLGSMDFGASDFIAEVELPALLAAVQRRELTLFLRGRALARSKADRTGWVPVGEARGSAVGQAEHPGP